MTTKRKKPQPRGRVRAKPVTALARRASVRPTPARRPRVSVMPAATDLNVLGEEATLGALGLVEITLTDKEEAVLARPVSLDDILVKPVAHGTIYLSHPTYTRWFNEAFGRLGWGIVPRSKPMRSGNSVVCPYVLYIHGKPAAFAMGEQEYSESNHDQSYGDALEATVASALRRCAKRLGVGLELWDRRFCDRFLGERAVRVQVKQRDGTVKKVWRLKSDHQLAFEEGTPMQQTTGTPHTEHAHSNDPINEKQLRRLWTILRNAGRDELQVKAWLACAYNIGSTKDIPRRLYDTICTALESSKPLPAPKDAPVDREPGEEG